MSLKKVFLTLEQEIHYENVTLVKAEVPKFISLIYFKWNLY